MQSVIIAKGNIDFRRIKALEVAGDVANSDFLIISTLEKKKNISIDQVRGMISFLSIKPESNNRKVVLINESQDLSLDAQNSLLKILEEPPIYAQIILTVNHQDNLIQTVRSRSKIIEIEDTNNSNLLNEESIETAKEFTSLLRSDPGKRIDWVMSKKADFKNREHVSGIFSIWELVFRDLLLISFGLADELLFKNLEKEYIALSSNKSVDEIRGNLSSVAIVKDCVNKNNVNSQLAFESLLLNF